MTKKHTDVPALPIEATSNGILMIRGQKVMLDFSLADLYGVETKVLKQAVRRNIDRFPEDFMFQLTNQEYMRLRSQIVTSNRGGHRYAPYAFTEQGVAMLSTVLRSPRAIHVNIEIMRAFVRLRQLLFSNEELAKQLVALEEKYDAHHRFIFLCIESSSLEFCIDRYVFNVPLPHIISAFRAGTKDGYISVIHACKVSLKFLVRTIRIADYHTKLPFNNRRQTFSYIPIKSTDFSGT